MNSKSKNGHGQCPVINTLIVYNVSNDLPDDVEKIIDEHLKSCERCMAICIAVSDYFYSLEGWQKRVAEGKDISEKLLNIATEAAANGHIRVIHADAPQEEEAAAHAGQHEEVDGHTTHVH